MEKKFIDIHAHAYRKPVPFVVQFCTPEELLMRYDQANIEKGALLPIVSPEIYFPQANEDILEMVENHPDRFFAFCNIDPRILTNSADAPIDRVLRYYKDKGCKGIGEIMPNMPMMHPMVQNLFKHAEEVGLPITFDSSDVTVGDFGLYDEMGMPQLEHTLQRFPKLDVFGHGIVFWAELSRIDRPAQRKTTFRPNGEQVGWYPPSGPIKEEGVVQQFFRLYPNLYGELSDAYYALSRDVEYGPKFLTEFQDRLFFGTDICCAGHVFNTQNLLIEWYNSKKISEEVFDKISYKNAAKYFKL